MYSLLASPYWLFPIAKQPQGTLLVGIVLGMIITVLQHMAVLSAMSKKTTKMCINTYMNTYIHTHI